MKILAIQTFEIPNSGWVYSHLFFLQYWAKVTAVKVDLIQITIWELQAL